jgi:hypothetical protein
MPRILLLICFSLFQLISYAQQDTLPQFFVFKKNKVITISWKNNYESLSQINIQRSKDSNRNYITIHSSPQPMSRSYSFTDQTAQNDSGYYRIFILFEGGQYFFTKPKRPVEDNRPTLVKKEIVAKQEESKKTNIPPPPPPPVKKETKPEVKEIQKPEVKIEVQINPKEKNKLPDSIKLKPATHVVAARKISKPYKRLFLPPLVIQKKSWEKSPYVYTGDDGNIVIDLPEAGKKKYSIVFVREEGRPLFTIPEILETKMILDKVVFLKSGWYYFVLSENGVVKERNKFLITRDF